MTARAVLAAAAALAAGACSNLEDQQIEWMSSLPDDASLAALSIPGTHDSGALYEPVPGLAKAQDLTFQEQLENGARYFDVRCRDVDDAFYIYHGAIDQNQKLAEVLATFDAFLSAHDGEAVIMSIKEEAAQSGETMPFDAAFQTYVAAEPSRWSLTADVPRLGDVRGKIVLLRRFDTTSTAPLGIDATAWPDDTSFAITDADAHLQVEDDYIVGSGSAGNDAKWADITANLGSAEDAGSASGTLFLTYTSGYQTVGGLPDITLVSDDINARLDAYLAAAGHAHLGALAMDHVTADRLAAVIATNGRP